MGYPRDLKVLKMGYPRGLHMEDIELGFSWFINDFVSCFWYINDFVGCLASKPKIITLKHLHYILRDNH